MAVALNPALIAAAAPPVSGDAVLRPGAVVDARVLQVLESNLVRIAIANLSIDVLSEVPLQPGQTLRLAVSQTQQGVRLAIVPSQVGAPEPQVVDVAPPQTVTPAKPLQAAGSAQVVLEAVAVATAAETAAARQGGLSQLFANLEVATRAASLPPAVSQAAAQLVAFRPQLTESLGGADVRAAFNASGLFHEQAALSQQSQPGGAVVSQPVPDLKSALIVLKQTLSVALAALPAEQAPPALPQGLPVTPNGAQPSPSSVVQQGALLSASIAGEIAAGIASPATPAVKTVAGPPIAPHGDAETILAAPVQERSSASVSAAAATSGGRAVAVAPDSVDRLILNALQIENVATSTDPARAIARPLADHDPGVARTNVPPPPFRGGAPSAQSIAAATIAVDAPAATIARHVLEDTDAAIARQTLLQIASLPDRVDTPGARFDNTAPRWSFEIPFSTPQGTAVAQFEIARDGNGRTEQGASGKIWRARFSLDVEPAGPVHALIALNGETTSVRMWAERPVTAAQLRASSADLASALRSADLQPGDIVIGDGAPPVTTPPAGHFLNRAS